MAARFTGGDGIIMTIKTAANYLGVVNGNCRQPGAGVMTGFAQIRSGNMRGMFSCCIHAIMAGDTGLTAKGGMVKTGYYPTIYIVAGITIQYCWHVARGFTGCGYPVMA